jgi:hypothetical protein
MILDIGILIYLALIGILFALMGSNVQSRTMGLVGVALAIMQGLKLVGIIP